MLPKRYIATSLSSCSLLFIHSSVHTSSQNLLIRLQHGCIWSPLVFSPFELWSCLNFNQTAVQVLWNMVLDYWNKSIIPITWRQLERTATKKWWFNCWQDKLCISLLQKTGRGKRTKVIGCIFVNHTLVTFCLVQQFLFLSKSYVCNTIYTV